MPIRISQKYILIPMNDIPAFKNYRMPAEWEPHSGTWLTWPHNPETWPNQDMEQVETDYLQIVKAITKGEQAHILVQDKSAEEDLIEKLQENSVSMNQVSIYDIPTNDSWIRDYGPNFIIREDDDNRELAINDWDFDSWGRKYKWELDDLVSGFIADQLKITKFKPEIVLEGGAIEVNGLGTCLTTDSCVLNPNRNDGIRRERMEDFLRNYLGASKIIWLSGDLEGDDTDGHIDNLARFVNPTTIVCSLENNERDANFLGLKQNYERLKAAKDQDGNPIRIIPLPMPGYVGSKNERLPASYANFYITNNAVLVPTYEHANDEKALDILTTLFPERTIIPIPCKTLIWGLGGIHCLTQQQPQGYNPSVSKGQDISNG
jgi:agmatine deiminase